MKRTKVRVLIFRELLERVCLGGLIEECLLHVGKDGIGNIAAVDFTNSVLLSVSGELGFQEGLYGFGSLPLLISYLKSCQDDDKVSYMISDDEKWLLLHKGYGKLRTRLIEPDLVGTALEKGKTPDMGALIDSSLFVALEKRFVDDALYYMGLVGGHGVEFNVDADSGKVILCSVDIDCAERFEIFVADIKGLSETFVVKIYGEQLRRVLTVLQLGDASGLYLAKDFPIIIQQNKDNMWALSPIVG